MVKGKRKEMVNGKYLCSLCQFWKPTNEFYKRDITPNSLSCWCKECGKTRTKEYRLKYPERKKETDRLYYTKNSKKISARHKIG